jgi:peptidoglycan/xylan/chitin deacetylase (PgdA/CDA1 family)
MNAGRHLALWLYQGVTAPLRSRAIARCRREAAWPVCVLFYHRVADWSPNAWTMPTRTFQRQITWLRTHFEIVSLREAQQRIAAGKNDRPTVCITFDDGYADNFDYALPLLLREKIPFTYFVASQHVLKGHPFPHDAAAGNFLRPHNQSEMELLARLGVEIGSHTRTHADLGKNMSGAALRDEVIGSKHELEDLLGKDVRYFAFPYGMPENLSREAYRVAHRGGYAGVASAYGAYNFPGEDAFHIRRIHADCEFIRLRNWLRLDPRKLRKRAAFDPGNYRAGPDTEGRGDDECRNPNEEGSPNEKARMTNR